MTGPRRRSERGSVAAELAVALPAVVLVLSMGVAALAGAARQVALQDVASDAARLLGRGESSARAFGLIAAGVAGASGSSSLRGELVCVTASAELRVGRLISVPLHASSCALAGGR